MKRKFIGVLLLALFTVFAVVSCKSTPPTEETPTEETKPPETETEAQPVVGVDKAALDELDAAIARANAARKLVTDFNGPALFPPDWQSADGLYGQAEQQKDVSATEKARESAARYVKAAEALEALAVTTLNKNYEIKEKELTDLRFAVVGARGEELIPDYLFGADKIVADADAKFKAKDYYAARDAALSAQSMYEVQKAGLDAYAVREEVVELGGLVLAPRQVSEADVVGVDGIGKYEAKDYTGAKDAAVTAGTMYSLMNSGLSAYKVREEIFAQGFEKYDSQNIALADETGLSAIDDYNAKRFPPAKEKADKAMLAYGLALKTGWEKFASEKSSAASAERQKALDLKANVAVRQDFNSAQTLYDQAAAALRAQNHPEAARLYGESISTFEVVNEVAREKRRVAEEALNRANKKMSESDDVARNAERILEGGAR